MPKPVSVIVKVTADGALVFSVGLLERRETWMSTRLSQPIVYFIDFRRVKKAKVAYATDLCVGEYIKLVLSP